MSLIAKAESFLKVPQPVNNKADFFISENEYLHFLKASECEKAGFLVLSENLLSYILSFPCNLDITTVHRFSIKRETLKEMLQSETGLTHLNQDKISILKNYFSSKEYSSLTDIVLLPLEKDFSAILVLLKSKLDRLRTPFELKRAEKAFQSFLPVYKKYKSIFTSAHPVYPLQKGADTISLKIKSALEAGMTANTLCISLAKVFPKCSGLSTTDSMRLFYSVINKILRLIGNSNIGIFDNASAVNLCLFSMQPIEQAMYEKQITQAIENIYGAEIAGKLVTSFTAVTKNQKNIFDFLTGKND